MKKILLLIFGTFLLMDCQASLKLDDYNNVSYWYYDSSVPSQYHRSYGIELIGNVYTYTVYSYSDELLKETATISLKEVKKIKLIISQLKGTKQAKQDDSPGSSAEKILIKKDSTTLLDVVWNYNESTSMVNLVNALKNLVRKDISDVGIVDENLYFEKVLVKKYRESLGNYILLSDSIHLNSTLQNIYPAIKSFFIKDNLNDYYVIPENVRPYQDNYLDFEVYYKDHFKFKLRHEIKKKNGEKNFGFGINPSGKSGVMRYDKTTKKITDFFPWE